MNLVAAVMDAAERAPLSDGLLLAGIDWLCGRGRECGVGHYRLAPVPR